MEDEEDLMIITASGTLIRTSMDGIIYDGRNTQGVSLLISRDEDTVATVARVDKTEDEESDENDEKTAIKSEDWIQQRKL